MAIENYTWVSSNITTLQLHTYSESEMDRDRVPNASISSVG